MEYCQGILKKIERPERYTTILSAAITTVVATYFIRRAMKNAMKYKSLGIEEIPSPKGEWFFFGKEKKKKETHYKLNRIQGMYR